MLLRWWLKPRRNPEVDLKRLQEALQAALGDRLKSMVVFGSMAGGDYRPDRSNVNVLVMADLTGDALPRMGPALKRWLDKGHTPPVLVEKEGLDEFAQDFPIEFLDMQEEHRLLFGENPLPHLKVDKKHLKAQCEHDLALVQLRLRQSIALAQGNRKQLQQALSRALPSLFTLFRATLRLEENVSKLDKIKAVDQLAGKLQFNADLFHRLKDFKLHRETDDVQKAAGQVLDVLGKVLHYLRK